MAVVVHTNFTDSEEEDGSLDTLEIDIVEALNQTMDSARDIDQFLPSPQRGGTVSSVALRTLRMLRDAQERMNERGVYLRYYCDKCQQARCESGRRARDEEKDLRHSSVHFISMVLIRLAKAIRMVHDLPNTREALMAALVARNAAVEGDVETVDAFSRDWLGLADPEGWRMAVENALMGEWVHYLGGGLLRDPELRKLLDRHTKIEHRHLQPLWERTVSGSRLRLLQAPIADGLTLGDTVADLRRPEDNLLMSELENSRLSVVLRGLNEKEAAVATAWAADPRATWAQAAAALGHRDPASFGDRVRRKLKRLGTRLTERMAAAEVAW